MTRVLAPAWLCVVLAACSSSPDRPSGAALVPPATSAINRDTGALDDFATRHALAAEAATREKRWADAVYELDVLRALRPADTGLLRLREHAQRSAVAAAQAHLQQARAAQQRGDSEVAAKLYLETLALAPDTTEAADSLRALERERNQRVQRNRSIRSAAAQRTTVDAAPGSAAATVGVGAAANVSTSGGRNDTEHANLLADQGEIDGAIAVMVPVVEARRTDRAARTLLADLYFRKAQLLQPNDPAQAIKALQRSLQVDRRHTRAAKLLAELRTAAAR